MNQTMNQSMNVSYMNVTCISDLDKSIMTVDVNLDKDGQMDDGKKGGISSKMSEIN